MPSKGDKTVSIDNGFGVNLITIRVTPLQRALLLWMKANPYSRIELVIQDGVPIQALVITEDGVGKKSVLFSDVAKKLKFLPSRPNSPKREERREEG